MIYQTQVRRRGLTKTAHGLIGVERKDQAGLDSLSDGEGKDFRALLSRSKTREVRYADAVVKLALACLLSISSISGEMLMFFLTLLLLLGSVLAADVGFFFMMNHCNSLQMRTQCIFRAHF